jgi:hypothetical protein
LLRDPTARKVFLILWFLASTVLITGAALIVEATGLPVRLPPPVWLPALQACLVVLTVFSFAYTWALPWILRKRPLPSLQRESAFLGIRLGPEFQPLLIGLMFGAAPASYGLVLFLLGAPLSQLYLFASAAFVETALWGLYNLVRMEPS